MIVNYLKNKKLLLILFSSFLMGCNTPQKQNTNTTSITKKVTEIDDEYKLAKNLRYQYFKENAYLVTIEKKISKK